MDSVKEPTNDNNKDSLQGLFSDKNSIIIILIALLLLSFLGINFVKNLGDFFQYIINGIAYFLRPIFNDVTFITGTVIDSTTDIAADAGKTGIDIAHGTGQSIADLFIRASNNEMDKAVPRIPIARVSQEKTIDNVINTPKPPSLNIPKSDSTTSPIQKPIASNKTGWCLIDEYEGKRSCISVGEEDKCMSNKVYPTQKMCLNPTLSK